MNSWERLACYPQGSFYPLSDGLSTQYHRITKPDFRPCSTCPSRSQAPFCLYTLRPVSVRPEGFLGASVTLSEATAPSNRLPERLRRSLLLALESQQQKGGIPTSAPHRPRAMLRRLPPILCICHRDSISSCSEAPWGLSVQSRVTCIFTGISISPGPSLRKCPNHYAFHAGRNLPDKEFRYLRTDYSYGRRSPGLQFDASLSLTSLLNLPAPGRRQHLYFSFRFRRHLCFGCLVSFLPPLLALSVSALH